MTLNVRDAVAGVLFIPAAVEVLGDQAELDDLNRPGIAGGSNS